MSKPKIARFTTKRGLSHASPAKRQLKTNLALIATIHGIGTAQHQLGADHFMRGFHALACNELHGLMRGKTPHGKRILTHGGQVHRIGVRRIIESDNRKVTWRTMPITIKLQYQWDGHHIGLTANRVGKLVQRQQCRQRRIRKCLATRNGKHLPCELMRGLGGESPRNGTYILNFFKCQPALNYGFAHPKHAWQQPALGPDALATADAMVDIMRFWLSRGADGFRVDMADSLVKHDDDGKPYTIRTWQYMFSKIRPEFPEVAFVSEWGRPCESLEAGFDMDFYLDWRWDGIPNGYNMLLRNVDDPLSRDGDLSYFNADSETPIASFLEQYEPQLRDAERLGGTFNFITCNHDTARIAPRLSEREIALAYCTLFAMPGTPFLYYGDEIGMRYLPLPTLEGGYARTGSRTPMQWSAASLAGLKAGAISHTDDETSAYLPVDPSADAPTVAESRTRDDSLWRIVHDMLHLRNETEVLHARGTFTALSRGRLFAFARSSGSQRVIIAVNPSRHSERLQLPEGDFTEIFHIGDIDISGDSLNMGLQSFAILRY